MPRNPIAHNHKKNFLTHLVATRRTVAESSVAVALVGVVLGDLSDVDGDRVELRNLLATKVTVNCVEGGKTYAKVLEEVLGLGVDLELAALGLGVVESRDLGNVLILALTLLFLELEGDTTDGSTLDTLHQVGGVTGNLRISKR